MTGYSAAHTLRYQNHHRKNLRARLTTLREQQVLYKSLVHAGRPASVLDLPCGSGRLWPALFRAGVTELIAADSSAAMLEAAGKQDASRHLAVRYLNTSALDIELADDSVDLAACLRFYHHLSRAEDRALALAELTRVSRRYIAISLWVDGNIAAARRKRKALPVLKVGYGGRICRRRKDVEAEFAGAGLTVVRHYDVWPRLQMWRHYLLEHGRNGG